ncbi:MULTISPECIES: CHAT domain-containing protein [Pseudanabaena]|uniref:CHAT domain-containing protein n=1 Tax=Pseudanabaena TaxID=1152 RepID=UPI0024784BE4|nr:MULTISPECIES: CHAT domain-containing protein [Pseudanabaena]MEA5485933.1 CHAT domain-containing protein [Pseudanabaena sp. CCNP1317]WGS71351.1 CHAT domain-containing protein [Pseudanabaena galeata CCNP1313]
MRSAMNGLQVLFVAFSLQILQALPAIAQVQIVPANDGTGTVVLPNGDRIDIKGGTTSGNGANVFHSFQGFNVQTGQTANFVVSPQVQNVLGGVTGGDPSLINGTIQVTGSNANLYLLNPAGFIFGNNAQLNVNGSFTASTARTAWFGDRHLDIYNPSYSNLSGNITGLEFDPNNPAVIVNSGNLSVNDGKSVTLAAPTVVNTGTVSAPNGSVSIVAVPDGRLRLNVGVEGLNFEFPQPKDAQGNPLPVKALDLPSLLTTGKLDSNTGVSLNSQGQAQLTNSQTVIPNTAGTAIVSGTVSVSSPVANPSQVTSKIQILGDLVGLVGANLDASGVNGGGSVFIGGDFQGKGIIPNALMTFVSANSTIKADALQSGNGGRVIVWADNATRFFGNISARGGAISGDGGFVEVSGKQNLVFDGKVDLNAVIGKGGTLLLDPTNIYIGNDVVDSIAVPVPLEIFESNFNGDDITISQTTIELLDGNFNLILEASNNIRIGDNGLTSGNLISRAIDAQTPAKPTLTLQTGTGDVIFRAGANFILDSNSVLQAGGRNITITAPNISTGTIVARSLANEGDGGNVELNSTGNIAVNGDSIDVISFGNTSDANSGSIKINAGGEVTIAGLLRAFSQSKNGGDVSVKATGDITFSCTAFVFAKCGVESFPESSLDAVSNSVERSAGNITIISTNGSVALLNNVILDAGSDSASVPVNSTDKRSSGTVIISAQGDITTGLGGITSDIGFNNGESASNISLTSFQGKITAYNITANSVSGKGGNVTFSAPNGISVNSVITGGSDSASSGGNITFNGKVVLLGDATISTGIVSSGNVTFTSTIDGARNLTITASTGTVNFLGNVGSTTALTGFITAAQNTNINGSISTANSDINLNSLATFTAPSTLNAGTGTIALNGGLAAGSNAISLIADQINLAAPFSGTGTLTLRPSSVGRNIVLGGTDLTAFNLTSAALSIITNVKLAIGDTSVGSLSVTAPITFNTSANLIASVINLNADITTTGQALTLTGNTRLNTNIAINSNNGNISTNGTVNSLTGNNFGLTLNAGNGNINLNGALGTSDRLSTISFNASNIGLSGGINTVNSLQISNPITITGNSTLSTLNGDINIGAPINIQAGTAANLTINAATGNVTTQDINLASAVGAGNSLTLLTPQGIVTTGNLNVDGTSGGNINIQARTAITTGTLSAVGLSGNGGNIFLDPDSDIFIGPANAQGFGGVGGTVDLTSNRFVRISGTFVDQNGLVASVSTAGTEGDGVIIIRHDGGIRFEPFNVFSSLINGTDGVLTTGAGNTIFTPRSFPGPYTQGNIQIITAPNFTIFLATQPLKEPPRVQWVDEGDRSPFPPEEFYTRQFAEFFKESISDYQSPKAMTLTEVQETLRRVQSETGVNPALLYVTFMPDRMDERKKDRNSQDVCYNPPSKPNAISPSLTDLEITKLPDSCDILELTLVTANGKPTYKTVKVGSQFIRRRDIESEADEHRRSVARYAEGDSLYEYEQSSQKLHKWLIQPLSNHLEKQEIKNLTFVLPNSLRKIPIAAIQKSRNQYLVQNYSVGLMPSLSLTDTRVSRVNNYNLRFLGSSIFSKESGLSNLPNVKKEASNVANIWNTIPILDSEFTEESLRNSSDFGIVHIATHAKFETKTGKGRIHFFDSFISLDRIREFNWKNVSMLVLSACETTQGNEESELGFSGAAVRANIKSVIGSLWKLDDSVAPEFMEKFYQELKNNPAIIKAEAFRRTQVYMFSDTKQFKFQHPKFWSTFTIIGNPW